MRTSQRLLAAVAVAVAVLGGAPPASAATPPPATITATPPQQTDCASAVAKLPKLAAAGVPDVECAELRAHPTARAIVSLVSKAPDGLPKWCLRRAFTGWWATETQACSIQDWFLKVYDTTTAQVVGTMGFLVFNLSSPATGDDAWQQHVIIRSYGQTGSAVGTGVWGLAFCDGNCDLDGLEFPTQKLTYGADVTGDATFFSWGAGSFESSVTFLLTNPGWFTPGIFSTIASPRGQCDDANNCTFV
ncbi:hypothetical protein [Actinoplanes sp. NPDC026619]|uniref:hypothetical protein n=1 Tax=Actinoplanes sp. NPDC026619 TaxID=3155798 RepID=UPI00340E0FC3